ncbi:hypothetical protein PFISCL1PPCAC_24478, partial [Pristionchus fissidentatus]
KHPSRSRSKAQDSKHRWRLCLCIRAVAISGSEQRRTRSIHRSIPRETGDQRLLGTTNKSPSSSSDSY